MFSGLKVICMHLSIMSQPSLAYSFFVRLKKYLICHNTRWISKLCTCFIVTESNRLAAVANLKRIKSTAFAINCYWRHKEHTAYGEVAKTRHIIKGISGTKHPKMAEYRCYCFWLNWSSPYENYSISSDISIFKVASSFHVRIECPFLMTKTTVPTRVLGFHTWV